MSTINLERSIQRLAKCYTGVDVVGQHIIDSSRLKDDLAFKIAMHRVTLAVKNKELTSAVIISQIKKESKNEE